MKTVDARGLSCPEPVMLTDEAVKSGKRPIKVLVSEPHQKMKIEKYAKDHDISFTTEETEDGFAVMLG